MTPFSDLLAALKDKDTPFITNLAALLIDELANSGQFMHIDQAHKDYSLAVDSFHPQIYGAATPDDLFSSIASTGSGTAVSLGPEKHAREAIKLLRNG